MEPMTGIIIIFVVAIAVMAFFAFSRLKPEAAAEPGTDEAQSK